MAHSIHEFLYVLMYIHIGLYNKGKFRTHSNISGSSTNNFCHFPFSKTSPTPFFLKNNIKLNGIPRKQNYFFLFLGVLHQLLHQQIFSVNFSELIENHIEEDFCHKNVFKTPLTPTPSTANCSFDKIFLLMLPEMKFCFSKYIPEVHFLKSFCEVFQESKTITAQS